MVLHGILVVATRAFSLVVVAVFAVFSLPVHAEEAAATTSADKIKAVFEATEVKIKVEPGQKSFVAEWKYTNPWEFPLAVSEIDSSCGCLAAPALDYKSISQGESSSITAKFTPGNHRGVLRKSLHVRFVGHEKPVELVVEAHIPSPVELSSQMLTWMPKSADLTKTIEVTTGTDQDFQITGLLGVADRLYIIKQETVTANRHYRLHVTPTEVEVTGIQTLQVRTNAHDPRDQVLAVFLRSPKS